jgi:hypothetical protein
MGEMTDTAASGAGADDASDGKPQPASGPMDKETADWYVQYTDGQFQAFLADDGKWYLYTPRPVEIGVQPTVPTRQTRRRDQ